MSNEPGAITLKIGESDHSNRIKSFMVERDIGRPDIATIELSDLESTKLSPAAAVEISMEDTLVFVGELVEFSTTYGGGSGKQQTTTIKAMNQFHRLTRGRQSRTFPKDMDDEKIVNEVAAEGDLTKVDWGPKNKKFPHDIVLWTNQTPMEFLTERAQRFGYHIWCVGQTLYCHVPDLEKESGFELILGLPAADGKRLSLTSFLPRMSSSETTKTVTVRSSDPASGKVIEGSSESGGSALGDVHAVSACGKHGKKTTEIIDNSVASIDEAKAIANAHFLRQSLKFITAEAELVPGNAALELAKTVKVDVDGPFSGRYYVKGITHRFIVQQEKDSHWVTRLALARDAQAKTDGG